MDDFPLPSLAPHLKLSRGPDAKGEPSWTLHNPIANTYFKLDWVSFECLARFPHHRSAQSLKSAIEAETTLSITLDEIAVVVEFLHNNALVSLKDQKVSYRATVKQPLWKKILHGYLYITIPLFKPQTFLEKTYPAIAILFSRTFVAAIMSFLAVMLVLTLPRADEFFHTFTNLFSIEGAIAGLLVLSFVKIIHEFAHAYTAVRYGVSVPHMGVALIVMYPVLYTETSGSWALSSRRARFHIAVAGIVAELCLAAIFLALWHISPSGSTGQTLSFLVVAVSLVSSLLVNLNPLMRFDGYYMFSDATGFDNLQGRSCAFARHRLREILFDLDDAPPEDLPVRDARFLTLFGTALLVYRFFLFVGIAVLVYQIFFQPLGLFLMLVELTFFIFLPVLSELKIWWEKRNSILSRPRSLIPACIVLTVLLLILLPWQSTMTIPAVLHAARHQLIFASAPAQIISLSVEEGQSVKTGQLLATLESPGLETDLLRAKQELKKLETLRSRGQSNPALLTDSNLSEEAIEKARLKVAALEEMKERLRIKAPFDGIVRDKNTEAQPGRYIGVTEPLFTLIDPTATEITGYADEDIRDKITIGSHARFFSDDRYVEKENLVVGFISQAGGSNLAWPELASTNGGPVAVDMTGEGDTVPRRSLYEVRATLSASAPAQAERGYLRITTSPSSIFVSWIRGLGALVRQEGRLG